MTTLAELLQNSFPASKESFDIRVGEVTLGLKVVSWTFLAPSAIDEGLFASFLLTGNVRVFLRFSESQVSEWQRNLDREIRNGRTHSEFEAQYGRKPLRRLELCQLAD